MFEYHEINEILINFDYNSYNQKQIGSDKQVIMLIYKYLRLLNVSKETTNSLIKNIAYLKKENLNISLFLHLLSIALCYLNDFSITTLLGTILNIHNIYYKTTTYFTIKDCLHMSYNHRIKKLFLKDNKYILKDFNIMDSIRYINSLKLVGAINLNQKEYNEFFNYIDDYSKYQESYSPLIIFKTYLKIRSQLKKDTRLFWDILYGNEYIVALNKYNIEISSLYNKNIFTPKEIVQTNIQTQLDLFTCKKEKILISENVKCFQVCTLYNTNQLPDYKEEKDLLLYYNRLLGNKEIVILPKLKNDKNSSYVYDTN